VTPERAQQFAIGVLVLAVILVVAILLGGIGQ